MSIWQKRGNARNIKEYLIEKGLDPYSLVNPKATPPEWIGGLSKAAEYIKDAIAKGEYISVFGDYDADGECASAILWLTLEALGMDMKKVIIRLPKRFSEGYGINPDAVDEFPMGLIICIDNGIAAHESIEKAIDKGYKVVVIDHHLAPEGALINAHVVVDQHVEELRNNIVDTEMDFGKEYISDPKEAFVEYCGAGLALKLAELLLSTSDREVLLNKMTAIAAIATVADSVPLLDENRLIVQKGLALINRAIKGDSNCVTKGLMSILKELGVKEMRDEDIAFKLAPIMNAPARLMDDGARLPCAIISADKVEIPHHAKKLIELNTLRKTIQTESINRVNAAITEDELTAPIVIFDPEGSKGLIGIVAGQLAEQYKIPAVVFALSEDGTTWDGSIRTYGDVHIKDVLDKISHLLVRYGGHAGAAGLGIAVGKEEEFKKAIKAEMKDVSPALSNDVLYYDLETTVEDIPTLLGQLNLYAPFGQSVPSPVIKIANVRASNGYAGKYGFIMGNNNQHIRIEAFQKTKPGERKTKIQILGFGIAHKFLELGSPQYFDALGTLGYKNDNYGKAIQFNAEDFSAK